MRSCRRRCRLNAKVLFTLVDFSTRRFTIARQRVTLWPPLPACLPQELGYLSYEGFRALDAYTVAASSNPDGP